MHTHKSWFARALALAGLTVAIAAAPATAQTPEGTTIRNIASTTFTDANGNAYAAVADTVDITMGFVVGLSLTPDNGSQSPASPSTGNALALTIENVGNGVDTVQVAESITGDVTVISSVDSLVWNATMYANIAALNTDLASYELTAGATTLITAYYTVPSSKGGLSANYQLTATSVRDGGESNPGDYDITAGETFGVTVIEQGSGNDSTTANLLPGTNQTAVFTVTNNGNGPEDFRLETSQNLGAVITVVSITGTNVTQGSNLDSAGVSGLAASASVNVTVTFDVADLAAGTVDSLFFLATAEGGANPNDESAYIVTIVKPSLTITKQAFTNSGLSSAVSGPVLPGESIWYKITISNSSGTASAVTIDLDDTLPSQVTYVTHGDDTNPLWTITETAGHIDAALSSLGAGASAYFWIEVSIN